MTSPVEAFISLGSNIDPAKNIAAAISLLRDHCLVLAQAAIYRTPPQGDANQADFLNTAVKIQTTLSPVEFKTQVIANIEQQLGRVRDPSNKNAPRTIDLDIALWGNDVLDYGDKPWHIPDPDITRFAHIALPLADIAPDTIHPETDQTLAAIAASLDTTGIHRELLESADNVLYIVNIEGAIWHDGRYLALVRGAAEEHAAGLIGFVGGKVEGTTEPGTNVFEETLRREIREEVGLEVSDITYATSRMFAAGGVTVINVVMLCRYESGEIVISDPGEVAEALWLTPAEIRDHPRVPPWITDYLQIVDGVRATLGW
jgi:2-amino-4-hydroxy-6-hydroxymethyldihydropteridine diphosphokinase